MHGSCSACVYQEYTSGSFRCLKLFSRADTTHPRAASADRRYPYHVFVTWHDRLYVFRSRSASMARDIAECLSGEFWRFSPDERYPDLLVCDFGKEMYRIA